MTIFSPDHIARARRVLADPYQAQSPNLRALRERIARHVIASAEGQRTGKVITIPRAVFQAALRNPRLTCIDGGRK